MNIARAIAERSATLATLSVMVVVTAACGDPVLRAPGELQVLEPADEGAYEPVARLPCGTFPLAGLDAPTGAENMQGPEFDALRRAVRTSPGGYGPATWRLVDRDADSAMFVTELETEWACLVVSARADTRIPLEGGEATDLNVALSDDLSPAQWKLAGGRPPADATELDVLVEEQDCASGSYASGRILPPLVESSTESLTITFGVRPMQSLFSITCPSNPWTPAILVLPEAVGDRILLDGSVYPPADRTEQP